MKVSETGWFGRDNPPEELNFKPVSDAIFNGGLVGENGTPGSNSDIIPSMAIAHLFCVSASTKRKP